MAEREPIPHDKMQGLAWEQMQRERAFSIWQEWVAEEKDTKERQRVQSFLHDDVYAALKSRGWNKEAALRVLRGQEESDIESALMVMQSLMTAGIEAFEQDDIMKVLNECGWDKNEAFTKLKSMHAERQGRGKKQKVEVLDPLPSSSSRQPVEHVSTKEVQAKDSEDGHRSGTSGGKDRKRKEHEEEFKIGQLIEAKYRGGKKMYPGIISAIWPGGKYNITYDDGDREFGVDKKMIRLCRDYDWCKKQELNVLEVGERVYGRWNHSKGEKLWYLGKVVQVESTEGGGRYTIQYDDGDREPNVKRMNLQTAEERKNASVHCAPAMSTGVVQEASAELDDGVMCELEGLFSRSVRKKRTIFNAANEDEEGDDGTKKRKRKRVKEQSDFIGVKRLLEGVKRGRKWEAFIEVEQEKHRLGAYKEEREAARAYDMAAMRFFGTSAMLNFASSRKGYEPTPELEDVLEEIRGLYKVKVKEEEEEGGEANMDARVANERTKIQDDSKKISEATTKVTGRKEEEQNLKDREEKKNLIIDDDDDLCLSEEIPLAKLYSKKSLREVEEKAEAKEPRSESKSDDVSGKMAGKKSAKNQDEDKEGKSDEAMNPQKLQKNELKEMREMKEKKERKDEKDDDEKKEAKEESEKRIVTVKAMKDMKDKDVSSKHVTKLKDLSKVNGVQIKKLPREEKKENAFKRDETKSNHSNKPHEKEAKQKRKLRLQVESDDDDQVMSVNTKKTVKIDKKNPFKEKTAVQQGGTNVEQVMNDRATTAVKDVQETMLSATVLQGKKSKKNNSEGQLSETSKTHLGNQGGKGSARREGEEKIAQDKTTKGSTQPETEMNPEGSLQSKTNVNPDRTKPKEREIKLSTKSALKGKISSSKTFEQNDVTIAFEKTHEISTTLLETDPTSSENKSVQQREVDTSMSNPAQVSVSTSSQAPQSNKQDDCSIPTDVKIPSQPDGSLPSREVFLSLLDPISNELMTHPCKGAECSHQSCFDKPSFLKSKKVNIPNEKKWESNIKTVIRIALEEACKGSEGSQFDISMNHLDQDIRFSEEGRGRALLCLDVETTTTRQIAMMTRFFGDKRSVGSILDVLREDLPKVFEKAGDNMQEELLSLDIGTVTAKSIQVKIWIKMLGAACPICKKTVDKLVTDMKLFNLIRLCKGAKASHVVVNEDFQILRLIADGDEQDEPGHKDQGEDGEGAAACGGGEEEEMEENNEDMDAASYASQVAQLLSDDDEDDGEMEEDIGYDDRRAGAGAGTGAGAGAGAGGGMATANQPRYEAIITKAGLSNHNKMGGFAFAREEDSTETYLNLTLYLLPLKAAAPRSCRIGGFSDVLRWLIGKKVSYSKRLNNAGRLEGIDLHFPQLGVSADDAREAAIAEKMARKASEGRMEQEAERTKNGIHPCLLSSSCIWLVQHGKYLCKMRCGGSEEAEEASGRRSMKINIQYLAHEIDLGSQVERLKLLEWTTLVPAAGSNNDLLAAMLAHLAREKMLAVGRMVREEEEGEEGGGGWRGKDRHVLVFVKESLILKRVEELQTMITDLPCGGLIVARMVDEQ